MSYNNCVIAVCSSDENIKDYITDKLNHNNTKFCSSFDEIKKLQCIDILIVCDTMVRSVKKHIDYIRHKFSKIKIICVIKDDPLLSNELISIGCDGIIRKTGKCTEWVNKIVNKVNIFKKIYDINTSIIRFNDRRKTSQIVVKNGRRKIDHMVALNA